MSAVHSLHGVSFLTFGTNPPTSPKKLYVDKIHDNSYCIPIFTGQLKQPTFFESKAKQRKQSLEDFWEKEYL